MYEIVDSGWCDVVEGMVMGKKKVVLYEPVDGDRYARILGVLHGEVGSLGVQKINFMMSFLENGENSLKTARQLKLNKQTAHEWKHSDWFETWYPVVRRTWIGDSLKQLGNPDVLAERLSRISRKAEDDGKYGAAVSALDVTAKLAGHYEKKVEDQSSGYQILIKELTINNQPPSFGTIVDVEVKDG